MSDTAAAVEDQEGPVIPAPPPDPTGELAGDDYDPTRGRLAHKVWDLVAVYGPIKQADLFSKTQQQSGNAWRQYLRFHPGVKEDAYKNQPNLLDDAERWWFDQEIKFSLRNGYLLKVDGLLSIGRCPPEHIPLNTVGGERGVRATLDSVPNDEALKILLAKETVARMKPTREGKRILRESLKAVGQLYAVRMWQPPNPGAPPVVIDGTTRMELLKGLGIEPRPHEWLSEGTSAQEALLQRIHHEIAATSKDQSKETRDQYISQLASEGVKQEEIGKRVGLSQRRVSEILSTVAADRYRGQPSPTQDEINDWVIYHDAGWSYRAIAEQLTGWSKSVIQKWVERAEVEGTAPTDQEIEEQEEQDEVEAVIIKLPPSSRATTAKGKRAQAKAAKPKVDAAEKHGAGVGKTVDVTNNSPAVTAAVSVDDKTALAAVIGLIERFGEGATLGAVKSVLSIKKGQ